MRKKDLVFTLFLLTAGLQLYSQQLVPFLKGKEWKVYDKVQRSFLKENYQNVVPSKCNLLFVQQNEKWGVMDKNRKLLLPIDYLSVQQINANVIAVKDKSGITLCDTLGKAISKEHFTEAAQYKKNQNWIVVRTEKSKFGIIDSKGKYVLPAKYDFAPEHTVNGFVKVAVRQANGSSLTGLLDSSLKVVLDAKYHSIQELGTSYKVSVDGETYEWFTSDFVSIYKGKAEPVRVASDFIMVRNRNTEQYGFYNRKSKDTEFCPEDCEMRIFEDSGLVVFKSEKGKVNHFYYANGEHLVLKNYFVYLGWTFSKYILISDKGENENPQYGFIDWKTKVVVPCKFKRINRWNNYYFSSSLVMRDEKGKYYNRYELYSFATGEKAVQTQFEEIELLPLGGVALKENGSWRLFDYTLKRWDDWEYSMVWLGQRLHCTSMALPLYQVDRKNGTYYGFKGYIDGTGRPVIPAIYRDIRLIESNYRDGKSAIRICAIWNEPEEGNPYGINHAEMLDQYGRKIPIPECSGLGYSMNNLITLSRTVKYEDELRGFTGLIDTMGNLVMPMEYDEIRQLGQNQGFICTRNGISVYADVNGKLVPSSGFSYMWPIENRYFVGTQSYKQGIISAAGKPISSFAYEEIRNETWLHGTLLRVKRKGVEFYIDNNGNEFYSEQ